MGGDLFAEPTDLSHGSTLEASYVCTSRPVDRPPVVEIRLRRPSNEVWNESTCTGVPSLLRATSSGSISRPLMAAPRLGVVVLAAAVTMAGDARAQTFRPTPGSPIDEGAWYPLVVTGGRVALDALGVPPSVDLGSTMVELIRRLHLSASPPPELTGAILKMSLAVADLRALQNAVAFATTDGRPPALAMAANRDQRKRLETALGAAGLSLREGNNQFVVVDDPSERGTALRIRLKMVGLEVEAVRVRLMNGEPFTFSVPTLELPLPLSPRAWAARILQRGVAANELFTAILSDTRARLLYHGLVGMDANTRRWISNRRPVLNHLYRDEESVRSF